VAIRGATLLVKAYDIDPVMAGPPEVFLTCRHASGFVRP
jgi:hypothetical protein